MSGARDLAEPAAGEAVLAEPRRTDGYLPIEDYGAIGDGRTLALVGIDGSIDWMCLPDLDAPSVFGALLDPATGGSFSLSPSIPYEVRRSYRPQTNVLETEYETADGKVRVIDAVTVDNAQNAPWRELVRKVEGMSGEVPMQLRFHPRFDYGRCSSEPARFGESFVYRHNGLQIGVTGWDAGEPQLERDAVSGAFQIRAGAQAAVVLVAGDGAALPLPDRDAVERRFEATHRLWRDWVERCNYEGPWKAAVQRSLLAIRLLADGRTGAITAAGTTSLPEALGKQRNYDYRFAWVRDLSFTLNALLRVGMEQLAEASVNWLLDAVAHTAPRVDPVYRLTGEPLRRQLQLPLAGYRGTSPVHLGNQAGTQLQLGGFGDLVETLWHYVKQGHVLAPGAAEQISDSVDLLCSIWRCEDAGLWELGDYAQYMTSKVSCWTALDRLLDLVEMGQAPPRHVARWQATREAVREFIETELWSGERGSYVMKAGSQSLDCGVLLAARRRYVDPRGERMNRTIDAIQRELDAGGPLYYRYSGMENEENAFLACSFWMVEALALAGRLDEAAELMGEMVSLGGELGLYSEEMEPVSHAMRGNYPQALTHLALINAAAILAEADHAS
ncbi:MAG TPA: glycoside hydrolase family 15 protein [Solirubrobacteraceae bacterium]|nr:glycoside hydrolase family 15 protein [Solirubrobacteraceae bacterium]